MAKIALWVRQFDPKFFYVNTLFDPPYFNIQTLPKQIKNIANSRYSDLKDFQPTLRFMNSADRESEEIQKQRKNIKQSNRVMILSKHWAPQPGDPKHIRCANPHFSGKTRK